MKFKKILMMLALSILVTSCGKNREEEKKAKEEQKIAEQAKLEEEQAKIDAEKVEKEKYKDFDYLNFEDISELDFDLKGTKENEQFVFVRMIGINPKTFTKDYTDEVINRIKELIGDKVLFQFLDSYPGENTLYYSYVWLEDPLKDNKPMDYKLKNNTLQGVLIKEGYFEVDQDDELISPYKDVFLELQHKAFEDGVVKWYNPVKNIGKNPETGEIIENKEKN